MRMKVLIIRFSSIGDIVLTTPVIRGLKQQAGAEIHYLTKKSYTSILEANPYIDKVFSLEEDMAQLLPQLKVEQYDYLIDLHKNLRSQRVKLSLGVKSYSFDKINTAKWLMVNLKINRLPAMHIVDRYMATIKALGVAYDGKGLDYFIPEEEEVEVANFLTDNVLKEKEDVPAYIAFAIGAAHATKRLPREKIIEICQQISVPVFLLGGPAEQEEGYAIAGGAGGHVFNGCGIFSLHQSASIVRQASHVITHDTGMMHIAAAFNKPITSIWGNTIPAFGMSPLYDDGLDLNTSIEVDGLSCRPCSKIGYDQCPKGHFKCMQEVDIPGVLKSLEVI
jgi:ADP-heptose:LPS heptosyltransferase